MIRKTALSLLLLFAFAALPVFAQGESTADRDATREKLRATLSAYGVTDAGAEFHQSSKNEYNFVGMLTSGLTYADAMEIVISVTTAQTIGFRIYPHYQGHYINTLKAKKSTALMKQLLYFSDQNFLFWGADDTNDVFSGYTFTLESGYPEDAIRVVLRSIPKLDQFVGEMRPLL